MLEEFAWSNVLLGFDFDGTLAPIVSVPERAALRPGTRALLGSVAALYPCVVISGRARADVARRIPANGMRAIIGNHGMEPWQATPAAVATIRRTRPLLQQRLTEFPGVTIEDKTYSLAAHYRRSRSKRAAQAAIVAAASAIGGLRIMGGKQVVNLVPAGSAHKGSALERERARARCDTAIFVGDDDTDEDVFALDQPGRLLTIRVGRNSRSLASYFLPRQSDIDALLRTLTVIRRGRREGVPA